MFEDEYAVDDLDQLPQGAKNALKQALASDEVVRVIIRGPWNQAIVGTDFRLFILKKGLMGGVTFGAKMTSWDYSNLTGIQYETGPNDGFVAIQGPSIASKDLSFWASDDKCPAFSPFAIPVTGKIIMEQAKVGVEILRDLIVKAHRHKASLTKAPGTTRKINKLAELRKQGLLTQEEFEAKKNEILSRT
jgi:hypothetical protein